MSGRVLAADPGLPGPGVIAEAQAAARPCRIGWLDPSPADFRDWRDSVSRRPEAARRRWWEPVWVELID